jgi:hypothetical protein
MLTIGAAIWEDFIHSNNQVTRMMVYKGAIIKWVVLLMWDLQQFAQYSNRGDWGPCGFLLAPWWSINGFKIRIVWIGPGTWKINPKGD